MLVKGRINSGQKIGGDILSIVEKIPHLKKLGVDVEIDIKGNKSSKYFDIVHLQQSLFNSYELFCHLKEAHFYKKPVVLKPLYNSIEDTKIYMRYGQTKKIGQLYNLLNNHNAYIKIREVFYSLFYKNFKNIIKKVLSNYFKMQINILNNSYLIPDSHMEIKTINKEFNININNYSVVCNSLNINNELNGVPSSLFFNKYKIKEFVLCAGRIEPLKNQVNLLEALIGSKLSVVICGSSFPYHKKYNNTFKELIKNNSNFIWLGYLDRKMLISALKNAHVVAIPSWSEVSPALGIEGGYYDCNIVTTNRGYGKEYFKDNAWYLDPNDRESIKRAVLDAYNSPKGCRSFKERISSDYSLQTTSQQLFNAYCEALGRSNNQL